MPLKSTPLSAARFDTFGRAFAYCPNHNFLLMDVYPLIQKKKPTDWKLVIISAISLLRMAAPTRQEVDGFFK
jgi:hypothetical protein